MKSTLIPEKTVELLAPAKNLQTGIVAIKSGADAVYIGAPSFGAREAAGNPLSDIAELVKYAHQFRARVYVTLNTLLYDEDIPVALEQIARLYDIKIDGLIIQDMGLLECALPPIPLIASTQTNNRTPEKVTFLEKVGFQRIILARELTLQEIQEIRQKSNVELEFFIHGSLCVCYSGQCYMSYAIGGRSGNRGKCAQSCRRIYSLVDSRGQVLMKNRYPLSLRDLNLAPHLKELLQAGINSFKIEGRLKDEFYVMNVVSYYRKELDRLLPQMGLKKSSAGRTIVDFSPVPAKTFSRDFTSYFLKGRDKNMGSIDTPKSIGEKIGAVQSIYLNYFILAPGAPQLNPGDGICFFDERQNLQGTRVNQVLGNKIFPEQIEAIQKGTLIYRNYDQLFLQQMKKSHVERKISVNLSLNEMPDGYRLIAVDEDGFRSEAIITVEKIKAQKPELAEATIKKQLSSMGSTNFECNQIIIDINPIPFIPIANLNTLRREVLENLNSIRMENHPLLKIEIVPNKFSYPEKSLTFEGNVLNQKAAAFYRRHGVQTIEPAAESEIDMTGRKVMTTRYCILGQTGRCLLTNKTEKLNLPLFLVDKNKRRFELKFNCKKCEMEVYSGRKK